MDSKPPQASLSMGIFQARILEWVAMPSSKESSRPRNLTHVSCLLHCHLGSPMPRHIQIKKNYIKKTETPESWPQPWFLMLLSRLSRVRLCTTL